MLVLDRGHKGVNLIMNHVCGYQISKVRKGRGKTGEENVMILEKREGI